MTIATRKIAAVLVSGAMIVSTFASVAYANQSNNDNSPKCNDNQTLVEGQCVDNQNNDNQGDAHGNDNHCTDGHGQDGNHGNCDNGGDNNHGDGHDGHGNDHGGNPPPVYVPGAGVLSIIKVIVGGTATPNQFSFAVNNGATTTFNVGGENDLTVATGTYSVLETATTTYTASYSGCANAVVNANATSTCTITNTFVPPAPVVPVCTESQTLVNNVCVDNPVTPTVTTDTNTGGNVGGGGGGGYVASGPFSIGYVNPNTGGGVVLGTSTEDGSLPSGCSALLSSYLRQGKHNDKGDVSKLQTFLNAHLGLTIPVTGYFGPSTTAGVNAFQTKYQKDVLGPWAAFGHNGKPTGYVYKTTQHQINILACSTLNEPFPQLP